MTIVWWGMYVIHRKYTNKTAYLSLLVFWISLEFLQHHWSIPWPWLTLGNGFANSVKLIQWYEFTGVLGGSVWILFSNILIHELINKLERKGSVTLFRQFVFVFMVICAPVFLSLYLYSEYTERGTSQNILVLQPNVDPYTEKFSGVNPESQYEKLLVLAEEYMTDSTEIIVAPETSLPVFWEDSVAGKAHALWPFFELTEKHSSIHFIGGALTMRKYRKGEPLAETARLHAPEGYYYDIFNSSVMLSNSDIQINHKTILVNGVERMPYQKYFSFLGKYVLNLGGTTGSLAAADYPVLLQPDDHLTIGSVICFESVFGEFTGKLAARGANLLVIITNDGWWKDSPGTWQHFGYSRLRAIETRRSIVQSANTGISGFINQKGDVIKKSSLSSFEAISSSMQTNNRITVYSRYGDYLGRWSLILMGAMLAHLFYIRKR